MTRSDLHAEAFGPLRAWLRIVASGWAKASAQRNHHPCSARCSNSHESMLDESKSRN